MGGVGPMFGQAHHFLRAAKEQVPYGIKRYTEETRRLYGVLQKRLSEAEYLADEYTIADIATFPWVARFEWHKVDLNEFPAVKRWFDLITARPAVARGMAASTWRGSNLASQIILLPLISAPCSATNRPCT